MVEGQWEMAGAGAVSTEPPSLGASALQVRKRQWVDTRRGAQWVFGVTEVWPRG